MTVCDCNISWFLLEASWCLHGEVGSSDHYSGGIVNRALVEPSILQPHFGDVDVLLADEASLLGQLAAVLGPYSNCFGGAAAELGSVALV